MSCICCLVKSLFRYRQRNHRRQFWLISVNKSHLLFLHFSTFGFFICRLIISTVSLYSVLGWSNSDNNERRILFCVPLCLDRLIEVFWAQSTLKLCFVFYLYKGRWILGFYALAPLFQLNKNKRRLV